MGVIARKNLPTKFPPEGKRGLDQNVFPASFVPLDLRGIYIGRTKMVFNDGNRSFRVGDKQVQAIPEALHVDDPPAFPRLQLKDRISFSEMLGSQFQALCLNGVSQLRWSSCVVKHSFVHEGHTMAPFCFVKIRSCHNYGKAICREMGEHVPKLAPRYRIDARRWFIQENHARLRDQCTSKPELLFQALLR